MDDDNQQDPDDFTYSILDDDDEVFHSSFSLPEFPSWNPRVHRDPCITDPSRLLEVTQKYEEFIPGEFTANTPPQGQHPPQTVANDVSNTGTLTGQGAERKSKTENSFCLQTSVSQLAPSSPTVTPPVFNGNSTTTDSPSSHSNAYVSLSHSDTHIPVSHNNIQASLKRRNAQVSLENNIAQGNSYAKLFLGNSNMKIPLNQDDKQFALKNKKAKVSLEVEKAHNSMGSSIACPGSLENRNGLVSPKNRNILVPSSQNNAQVSLKTKNSNFSEENNANSFLSHKNFKVLHENCNTEIQKIYSILEDHLENSSEQIPLSHRNTQVLLGSNNGDFVLNNSSGQVSSGNCYEKIPLENQNAKFSKNNNNNDISNQTTDAVNMPFESTCITAENHEPPNPDSNSAIASASSQEKSLAMTSPDIVQSSPSSTSRKSYKYQQEFKLCSNAEERRKVANALKARKNRQKKKAQNLELKGVLQNLQDEVKNLQKTLKDERQKYKIGTEKMKKELLKMSAENDVLREKFGILLSKAVNDGTIQLISSTDDECSAVHLI